MRSTPRLLYSAEALFLIWMLFSLWYMLQLKLVEDLVPGQRENGNVTIYARLDPPNFLTIYLPTFERLSLLVISSELHVSKMLTLSLQQMVKRQVHVYSYYIVAT